MPHKRNEDGDTDMTNGSVNPVLFSPSVSVSSDLLLRVTPEASLG